MPAIVRFLRLSRLRRKALTDAARRLVVVKFLVSIIGMQRTRRILESKVALRADVTAAIEARKAVLRAAEAIPVKTNCLDRAIALWWLLNSRGLSAELQIGVRLDPGKGLRAHAWVEVEGDALLDEMAAQFESLQEPDSGARSS